MTLCQVIAYAKKELSVNVDKVKHKDVAESCKNPPSFCLNCWGNPPETSQLSHVGETKFRFCCWKRSSS